MKAKTEKTANGFRGYVIENGVETEGSKVFSHWTFPTRKNAMNHAKAIIEQIKSDRFVLAGNGKTPFYDKVTKATKETSK